MMDEKRSLHPVAASALTRSALSAASASVSSILAAALLGQRRTGHAAAPLNGPSQWVFGRLAARRRRAKLRHTLLGYGIHHASSWLWATLFESGVARRVARRVAPTPLPRAAVVAALAASVEYLVVPKRFTPGFEAHLEKRDIAIVYAAFAAGLVLAERSTRRG